jgi:hypothetical protein
MRKFVPKTQTLWKDKNWEKERVNSKCKCETSGEGFDHAGSTALEVPEDLFHCARVVLSSSVHVRTVPGLEKEFKIQRFEGEEEGTEWGIGQLSRAI